MNRLQFIINTYNKYQRPNIFIVSDRKRMLALNLRRFNNYSKKWQFSASKLARRDGVEVIQAVFVLVAHVVVVVFEDIAGSGGGGLPPVLERPQQPQLPLLVQLDQIWIGIKGGCQESYLPDKLVFEDTGTATDPQTEKNRESGRIIFNDT